jgi:hypothetical protein
MKLVTSRRCLVSASVCALLAGSGAAQAAYNLLSVSPSVWGASDATLTLNPGSTIEDFESVNLVAGLQVRASAAGGSYGPTSTLPVLFDPSLDPNPVLAFWSYPCGVPASCSSLWDGTHSLVNTYTNQAMSYGNSANWGDIELLFAGGVTQVGFSLQQNEQTVSLYINGNLTYGIGGAIGGGRAGYFVIDVTGLSAPITSLRLSNSNNGDGWAIDHLAFTSAVPEPGSFALLLGGAMLFALRRRA